MKRVERSNGQAAMVDHMATRASRIAHQVVDDVTDRLNTSAEAITAMGKKACDKADEKITAHPFISVGIAFAAGAVGAILARTWLTRGN